MGGWVSRQVKAAQQETACRRNNKARSVRRKERSNDLRAHLGGNHGVSLRLTELFLHDGTVLTRLPSCGGGALKCQHTSLEARTRWNKLSEMTVKLTDDEVSYSNNY